MRGIGFLPDSAAVDAFPEAVGRREEFAVAVFLPRGPPSFAYAR
jgi:hypothetical protein